MIKLNAEEKNMIDGLCDVVLRLGGLKFQGAVAQVQVLLEVEKEAPKGGGKGNPKLPKNWGKVK
jgi:hypothetical protein